jgi:EAL domain-containing protein (putative c-di-GMP-specific phosphodiesterase class I)/GGDEF domain-containing protein
MAQFLGYSAFLDRLGDESRRDRGERLLGLAVINLDFISRVDGSYGYEVGDQLLRALALRLRDALPEADILGEVSRTELACLFPALPSQGHLRLAIGKVQRTLEEPALVGGHQIYPQPRIGVSFRAGAAPDAPFLLRESNLAMHGAQRRQDRVAYYDEKLSGLERLYYELQSELLHAIEENELMLYFQPLLDLRSGRILGSEALLRWNRPGKGFISPDKVVLVAERTGLIRPLTAWICNIAVRHCGELLSQGLDVSVSVNISIQNLAEPELPALISRALRLWNVPPRNLILELTETAMMEETPGSIEALNTLKDLGLKLAMDDFGTGYSSMARLKELPLDELKIDMRFVRDMFTSHKDEKLVHSMIELAHGLEMYVVAEGVETREATERLREMGCDVIQGYHLSKPLPPDQYVEFLRAREPASMEGQT